MSKRKSVDVPAIVIENNVPLPQGWGKPGISTAIRSLLPGQSFKVPVGSRQGIHSAARMAGVKIATRTQGDGTLRVWRVA